MVIINIFQVTSDRSKLNISLETSAGETIESIKLWTDETFKDNASALDLTDKLQKVSNKEVFTINSSELSINLFNGIYFIEVKSSLDNTLINECYDCNNNTLLGVTANLGYFDECLLDNILEVHYDTNDIDNNNQLNDIYTISKLKEGIIIAIKFGYYHNAIDMLTTLKVLCRNKDNCSQCGSLPNPVFKTGLNFGVIGNNLVMK